MTTNATQHCNKSTIIHIPPSKKKQNKQEEAIIVVSLREQSNERTNFQKSCILSLTIPVLQVFCHRVDVDMLPVFI
jgi:hypothetical protein